MSAFHGKFLLIDNNNDFIDQIHRDPAFLLEFPLLIQSTIPNGLKIFQKHKSIIRAVVVSTSYFKTKESLDDFKRNTEGTPCLYVSHKENIFLKDHFNHDRHLSEPKTYKEIVTVFKDLTDKKIDWSKIQESHDEKFVEVKIQDKDFLPIEIDQFLVLPKSHFNVFIRIGAGNYIKIVNSGEAGTKDILDRYKDKGFTDIYLPLTEHERYIRLCEKLSSRIIYANDITPKEKLNSVFKLGGEVSRSLLKVGLEPKNLDFAESFLDQSVSLIKNYQIKDGNLKKFISEIEGNEHSAAVSFLAGVIANELGFESLKSVKLVGIAALVHDIGLHDLAPGADENSLAPDSEIMLTHALHGANLLRKSGAFEETVCLAVEHHHFRRRGGNSSIRNNNMNLIAEIVGVADLFYNRVLNDGFNPKKLEHFVLIELKTYSPPIEKGFLKILNQKRKAG